MLSRVAAKPPPLLTSAGGLPAARIFDYHVCPLSDGPKPHVGGAILTGEFTVFACGLPVARVGDVVLCMGPPDQVANGSSTVLVGGRPVARMTDTCFHGGIIVAGCVTTLIGGPATSNWTVARVLAILCGSAAPLVGQLGSGAIPLSGYDRIYFDDPYYDGTQWTTKRFEAGGTNNGGITLLNNASDEEAATTLYHEGIHQNQAPRKTLAEREYDAYTRTEQWTLGNGLPSQADPAGGYNFRKKDPHGKEVVDEAEVRRFVNDQYPVTSAAPASSGGPPPPIPDQVIGRRPDGGAILQRSDGSTYTRSPQAGDTYPGPQQVEGERNLDPSLFQC